MAFLFICKSGWPFKKVRALRLFLIAKLHQNLFEDSLSQPKVHVTSILFCFFFFLNFFIMFVHTQKFHIHGTRVNFVKIFYTSHKFFIKSYNFYIQIRKILKNFFFKFWMMKFYPFVYLLHIKFVGTYNFLWKKFKILCKRLQFSIFFFFCWTF